MKLTLAALAFLVATAAWARPQGHPDDAKAHFDRGLPFIRRPTSVARLSNSAKRFA